MAVNDELVNLSNRIKLLELKNPKQHERERPTQFRTSQRNKHGNNFNVQYFPTQQSLDDFKQNESSKKVVIEEKNNNDNDNKINHPNTTLHSNNLSSEKLNVQNVSTITSQLSQKRPHDSDSETEKHKANTSSQKKPADNKHKSVKVTEEIDVNKIVEDQKNLTNTVNQLQLFFSEQFEKLSRAMLESRSNPKSATQ
jgi:hypothetical protein